MTRTFEPATAARHLLDAHDRRLQYANLPADIAPQTLAESYAAQEAFAELLTARAGPLVGLKIATTTKVMQELMGIDHPCGGMIFERTVHRSPAALRLSDYQHVVIECELAVRIGRDLPALPQPYTGETVRSAVTEVMPAFELIEDRDAHYKSTNALSLIADNCWNAGIVLGPPVLFEPGRSLAAIEGRLSINGAESHRGATDEPLATLAWIANLAVDRGRPMRAGMVVITGSVIPTLPIGSGDRFAFSLAGFGSAEVTAI